MSRRDDQLDFGLPGGKIDEGESALDAAVREFREEVGVSVDPADLCPVFDRVGFSGRVCRCFLLLATKLTSEPRQMEEGVLVEWLPPRRLLEPSCMFHQYNRALFAHLFPNSEFWR